MDNNSSSDKWTSENTIDADEEKFYRDVDKNHCNYDYIMESRVQPGKRFPAIYPGVSGARRRQESRLGVSRVPLLEMSGAGREGFYQQRLLLSLAWWCSTPVKKYCDQRERGFAMDVPLDSPVTRRRRRCKYGTRNLENSDCTRKWVQF